MQTSFEVEGLLATPQSLTPAANEEFSATQETATGWDPFEVWRTRVRAKVAPDVAKSGLPALV
jgi:hypothetical protein